MGDEFLQRRLPVVGKTVHRLGLAMNYGIEEAGVATALERGINYFFWTPRKTQATTPLLKQALSRDREKYVVASGPTLSWFAGNVRHGAEKLLRMLGTDYLDVLELFWVGVTSALTPATLDALARLKEEKRIRAIGISIHNRERAGRLAADSPIDLLMLRYNAAHPGAERDVFPHLARRHPAVVAYTATSWRKLLKRPSGWDGPVMTAPDCYRFCLTSPHVDVVLCGAKDRSQLVEDLDGLAKGPLSPGEDAWMRRFGQAVHG